MTIDYNNYNIESKIQLNNLYKAISDICGQDTPADNLISAYEMLRDYLPANKGAAGHIDTKEEDKLIIDANNINSLVYVPKDNEYLYNISRIIDERTDSAQAYNTYSVAKMISNIKNLHDPIGYYGITNFSIDVDVSLNDDQYIILTIEDGAQYLYEVELYGNSNYNENLGSVEIQVSVDNSDITSNWFKATVRGYITVYSETPNRYFSVNIYRTDGSNQEYIGSSSVTADSPQW